MPFISRSATIGEHSPVNPMAARGGDRPAEPRRPFVDVVLVGVTALLYAVAHRVVFPWAAENWGDAARSGAGGAAEVALRLGLWLSGHLWIFAAAFGLYAVCRAVWPGRVRLLAVTFSAAAVALMLWYMVLYAVDLAMPGGSV